MFITLHRTTLNYTLSNQCFFLTICGRYSLNHLISVGVCNFNRVGHIPGNVNHGHDGLDLLHLIPFKPFQSQLVLVCLKHNTCTQSQECKSKAIEELLSSRVFYLSPLIQIPLRSLLFIPSLATRGPLTIQWTHIPCNVIAPTHSLDPVHCACINPHQVSRPLDEAVHWNIGTVEILQHWPPWAS